MSQPPSGETPVPPPPGQQPSMPPVGPPPGATPPHPAASPVPSEPSRNEWSGVAGGAASSLGEQLGRIGKAGFFAGVFDYSFTKLVTARVLGVLYGLVTILLALGYIGYVVVAFLASPILGVGVLVVGLVVAFVYLLFTRVVLEFFVATTRTSQNTAALVELARRRDS